MQRRFVFVVHKFNSKAAQHLTAWPNFSFCDSKICPFAASEVGGSACLFETPPKDVVIQFVF